jgi:hypothetical protein
LQIKSGKPNLGPIAVANNAAVLGLVAEVPNRVDVASHRKQYLCVLVFHSQLQRLYDFHATCPVCFDMFIVIQQFTLRKSFLVIQQYVYNRRMEPTKKPRGRPPTPPDEKLEQRSIRLNPRHWAMIDRYGVEWLRKLIDKAKVPKD